MTKFWNILNGTYSNISFKKSQFHIHWQIKKIHLFWGLNLIQKTMNLKQH